jgi:hypothetical protein
MISHREKTMLQISLIRVAVVRDNWERVTRLNKAVNTHAEAEKECLIFLRELYDAPMD